MTLHAIDLLPDRTYTVLVSTDTSFTGQLPDDLFSVFSVSDQITTSGSSIGTVAKSFSLSEIAVAATIPSLISLFLLLTLITVIIVFVYKQQNNHNNSAKDRAYYSTIADLYLRLGIWKLKKMLPMKWSTVNLQSQVIYPLKFKRMWHMEYTFTEENSYVTDSHASYIILLYNIDILKQLWCVWSCKFWCIDSVDIASWFKSCQLFSYYK